MPDRRRYRCLNCGNRFEVNVLSRDEVTEAERRRQPLSSITCPECRRTDVRLGWD